ARSSASRRGRSWEWNCNTNIQTGRSNVTTSGWVKFASTSTRSTEQENWFPVRATPIRTSSRPWSATNGWSAERCSNFFISQPNTTRSSIAQSRSITKRFELVLEGGSSSRLLDAKFGGASAYSLHRPRSGRSTSKRCLAGERLSILHTNALAALRFLLHPLEAARQSSFYRRIHPINKKNSVQMIDFMLNGAPEQSARFDFDPAVFQSLRPGDH